MATFDRFADKVEDIVASATFFSGCVLLVVIWAPSYFLMRGVNTWQLIINTITTIVTFLLVALLQNTQRRFEIETGKALDLIGEGLDAAHFKLDHLLAAAGLDGSGEWERTDL